MSTSTWPVRADFRSASSASTTSGNHPGQAPVAQAHLGLSVPDLDRAEAQLLALGATKASPQPNEAIMRVLIDPAGHPFYVYVR